MGWTHDGYLSCLLVFLRVVGNKFQLLRQRKCSKEEQTPGGFGRAWAGLCSPPTGGIQSPQLISLPKAQALSRDFIPSAFLRNLKSGIFRFGAGPVPAFCAQSCGTATLVLLRSSHSFIPTFIPTNVPAHLSQQTRSLLASGGTKKTQLSTRK